MNKQKIMLGAIGIAVFSALGASPSLSRDYPFCRKGEAGPGDCRYDTYEQCLAAVSGTASYCQQNFWLQPSGRDIPPRRAPRN
ncbi:MAG: DUF3551 domain-containing protein [Afipia sp.]|nr:DUF3551 domain-containing protein [Afipia sp.]